MAGKQLVNEDGQTKVNDFALGTMTSSYPMGSTVKGATVLTGYQTGAIQPGSVQLDEPIKLKVHLRSRLGKRWDTLMTLQL